MEESQENGMDVDSSEEDITNVENVGFLYCGLGLETLTVISLVFF